MAEKHTSIPIATPVAVYPALWSTFVIIGSALVGAQLAIGSVVLYWALAKSETQGPPSEKPTIHLVLPHSTECLHRPTHCRSNKFFESAYIQVETEWAGHLESHADVFQGSVVSIERSTVQQLQTKKAGLIGRDWYANDP